ncbi:MAG: serine protease [Bacteriovoracaceae bacterium]
MKQSLLRLGFVTALSLFTAHFSFASSGQKVIYGEDNRVDVYASSDNLLKELSRSTAAQIENSSLSASRTGTILSGDSLRDRGMCASERFSSQITAARCSGFLVGKDLLVTAGHCVTQMGDCAEYSWVFDYKMTDATSINLNIPKSNIYKCTQIISRALDSGVGSDYALVKLDRPVEGREPLKVRKSGKIPNGASIAVIGHPTRPSYQNFRWC